MACNNNQQSTFGITIFYFFIICFVALIVLTIGAALCGAETALPAAKQYMTNPVGTWVWFTSYIQNPFNHQWIRGPWMLWFMYF